MLKGFDFGLDLALALLLVLPVALDTDSQDGTDRPDGAPS
jgi:hypothetical protein